jgi:hypothetical protein
LIAVILRLQIRFELLFGPGSLFAASASAFGVNSASVSLSGKSKSTIL